MSIYASNKKSDIAKCLIIKNIIETEWNIYISIKDYNFVVVASRSNTGVSYCPFYVLYNNKRIQIKLSNLFYYI